MSDHTHAELCKNVAFIGETKIFADHAELCCDAELDSSENISDLSDVYYLKGWRLTRGLTNRCKNLAPETYVGPNGESVQVLNSSQYSMIGEDDWTVIGAKRSDVAAFLLCFGFEDVKIEKQAIVQQTY